VNVSAVYMNLNSLVTLQKCIYGKVFYLWRTSVEYSSADSI